MRSKGDERATEAVVRTSVIAKSMSNEALGSTLPYSSPKAVDLARLTRSLAESHAAYGNMHMHNTITDDTKFKIVPILHSSILGHKIHCLRRVTLAGIPGGPTREELA